MDLGIEWQSEGGFLLGLNYTIPVGHATWSGLKIPGIHLGWIFL
jgi:hypothetical protein